MYEYHRTQEFSLPVVNGVVIGINGPQHEFSVLQTHNWVADA